MSVGFTPAANLLYQAGARMRYDGALEQFVPASLPPGVFAAGRVNGIYRSRPEAARWRARRDCKPRSISGSSPDRCPRPGRRRAAPTHPYPCFAHPDGKNFVDFDEDLQLKDFFNAAQEGFDSIELLKRYSTVGMGPEPGQAFEHECGAHPGQDPRRTGRAGRHHDGAAVLPSGADVASGRAWRSLPCDARRCTAATKQPAQSGCRRATGCGPSSMREPARARASACARRCAPCAARLGIIDVGTLGKMDLFGPDAAAFLERVYTGQLRQPEGRHDALRRDARRERGGHRRRRGGAACRSEHFYFTTTTTGSATVYRELDAAQHAYGACRWASSMSPALCCDEPRRAAVARRAGASSLRSICPARPFPISRCAKARSPACRCASCASGFVGELGYEIHTAGRARQRTCGMR